MRKLRCLAVILVLADVALIGSVVHTAVLARETMPAYNVAPVHSSITPAYNNNDTVTNVSSPNTVCTTEDTCPTQRWGVSKIEAPQAWQIAKGNQSVIVAVLDTGIDKNNQDLADKVVAKVNFTDSPTSNDLYGHGTHIAGTIAAIAPECQLMNVKVADDAGGCEPSTVARGIIWAVDHGAEVINLSLCTKSSPDLEEAVNYAWNRGAVIVAAAGNLGGATPVYPAYYANCIAVAATNENDSLALLSGHGDWVDVAAPGFKIYSDLPHNQYGYKSGTSIAVAHVSGEAALVFSVAKDANGDGVINDEVRQAIENSCSPIGVDGVGNGRINAFEAVSEDNAL